MKISLLGYMGSGKTTIGKQLSASLNMKFIDLDSFLEFKCKKSIATIFQTEGEIKFRKYEHDALKETLNSNENFVLALGGGTPAYYHNMEWVNQYTHSIYLRMTPKELIERLRNEKNSRPMISHLTETDFPEFIAKHLFERRNFYEQAKQKIDLKDKSVKEIVEEINLNLPPLQLK
ncbi:MAG TPA: shikimate kinase [Moheibacter sp.]|nr:shikimate kinase [Moheibacter sp.]